MQFGDLAGGKEQGHHFISASIIIVCPFCSHFHIFIIIDDMDGWLATKIVPYIIMVIRMRIVYIYLMSMSMVQSKNWSILIN